MSTTATDRIEVSGEVVSFGIEVRVPFSQAEDFARRMTGDDNDIVLAAERALRDILEYPEDG